MLLKHYLPFLPREVFELRVEESQLGQEFDGTYTEETHLKDL